MHEDDKLGLGRNSSNLYQDQLKNMIQQRKWLPKIPARSANLFQSFSKLTRSFADVFSKPGQQGLQGSAQKWVGRPRDLGMPGDCRELPVRTHYVHPSGMVAEATPQAPLVGMNLSIP